MKGIRSSLIHLQKSSFDVSNELGMTTHLVTDVYIRVAMLLCTLENVTLKKEVLSFVEDLGRFFVPTTRFVLLRRLHQSATVYSLQTYALHLIKISLQDTWSQNSLHEVVTHLPPLADHCV